MTQQIKNIDDLRGLVKRGYGEMTLKRVLIMTFRNEYCIGCDLNNLCRLCKTRKKYGIGIRELQS